MAKTDKPRRKPNLLLKQARWEQGFTDEELAEEIGTTKVSISRWETDSSKKPSPRYYQKLLKALKKQSIQELGFDLEDREQKPQQADDTTSEEGYPKQQSLWSMPYTRRNPFFTGREEILERLYHMLTKIEVGQSTRPVALTALGGVGKTQTVIEFVWRHRQDYQVVYWAKADDSDILAEEFVRLAHELKLPEATLPDQKQIITALKNWMNETSQWLIILDNVEAPEMLEEFLPEEPQGHLLMTSRAQAFGTIAQKIDLLGMEPEEGAWFLLRRSQKIAFDAPFDAASPFDQQQACAISQELGGLPLALDQAGGYIEETGCSLLGYQKRYREQHAELLKRRSSLSDPDYPWTVATTWTLSFKRVREINLAAAELLCFLAFLTPDDIPLSLVHDAAPILPHPLHRTAKNVVKLDRAIIDLRRFSLVQCHEESEMSIHGETLSIHRLVQTVLKDAMPEKTRRQWAERTVKAVHEAFSVRIYIPQAQACALLIEEWGFAFKEAANLIFQAGRHAQDRQLNQTAGSLYLQALSVSERVYKTKSMQVVNCLFRIAQVYQARKKLEEAETYYQRTLDIRVELRGSSHPTVAECQSALARLYTQQGNYEQAEAIFQELVEQEYPDIADFEANAELYMEQERYAEAEALIQRELTMLRLALEPTQPAYLKVTAIITYLADIYVIQGKMTEAETLLQQELTMLQRMLEPTEYQVMTINEHLVSVYMRQEKMTEAEALLRQIITLRQQSQGKDMEESVAIARNLLPLAEILAVKGAHAEAEMFYRRALVIANKHEIRERAFLLKLLMSYASFFLMMKREEEAKQLLERANRVYEEIQGHNLFWEGMSHYLNEGEIFRDESTDSLS